MCERSMGQDAEDDMLVESAGLVEGAWLTKEGLWIKYEDLTDSYLHNIIRYLHRRHSPRVERITEELEMERSRRAL